MGIAGFRRERSVMDHNFGMVPRADIPRSNFRRSHGHKTAFNAGYLVPIFVDEVLPGDSFNLKLSSVARLSTPIVPFMDNLRMDFFFFFVPNRLLWDNWQRFMGERDPDPDSSTDYEVPYLTASAAGGFAEGSLGDYFGLPTAVNSLRVNSLHFRAYNLIWNEWFRDENLQDSVTVDKGDGPDTVTDYVLLKRGKRHDYFTSCLPWPQKGDAVDLPIGDTAPVVTGENHHTESWWSFPATSMRLRLASDGSAPASRTNVGVEASTGEVTMASSPGTWTNPLVPTNLYADLSSATAATINSLREAFQLQRLLERDARGGTRYTEILASHFRVTSPDARLQRPEYLGGGSSAIQITPIAQTSESGTTKQGNLAAVGYHSQSGIGFTKSFVEHGVLLGLVCVRADLTYQQGLHRMWSRQTKYDFYWPALAHLGEQEVLNKELYCDGSANDDLVFGYQERWAEYRYFPSKITGVLRSNAAASLDNWHLSQEFGSLPALNASFIEENPPVDRVVAVTSEPQFIFDSFFDVVCTRPMPMYSVPGLIDHF